MLVDLINLGFSGLRHQPCNTVTFAGFAAALALVDPAADDTAGEAAGAEAADGFGKEELPLTGEEVLEVAAEARGGVFAAAFSPPAVALPLFAVGVGGAGRSSSPDLPLLLDRVAGLFVGRTGERALGVAAAAAAASVAFAGVRPPRLGVLEPAAESVCEGGDAGGGASEVSRCTAFNCWARLALMGSGCAKPPEELEAVDTPAGKIGEIGGGGICGQPGTDFCST
jgi:hypothetical protein